MRAARNWQDYEILDCSGGEKLERWKNTILVRPDPQIIWHTLQTPQWKKADAVYSRAKSGGGSWAYKNPKMNEDSEWNIAYKNLTFKIKPTGFKHTGLFPEQAVNWDYMAEKIKAAGRPIKVLNLFAYTGGATLACAAAGAQVCHVDASKGMVAWARENAALSGLADKPIRWIVDDCMKFIEREKRRGSFYDAIVMDPPSYGRGPGGEVWQLEEKVFELASAAADILSDNPLFFILNSYTTGLGAAVMEYLLHTAVVSHKGGTASSDEIGLPVTATGKCLPCGTTAIVDF